MKPFFIVHNRLKAHRPKGPQQAARRAICVSIGLVWEITTARLQPLSALRISSITTGVVMGFPGS